MPRSHFLRRTGVHFAGKCSRPEGPQWLMRFRNTLYEQSERYRRMAVAIRSTGRDIDAEHRAIVEAVLAGDADRATGEMARHIERTTAAIAEVHR
jgi:DNA-binding GntR family transcriptional regulator